MISQREDDCRAAVEIQRWNLLRPGFTLTSGPDPLFLKRRTSALCKGIIDFNAIIDYDDFI